MSPKHTDYVIAVISEEYGSVVSILILIIFLYISFRIIKSCFNQDNEFFKISLSGLASLLIFQTFIHAGVNTNLLPTTGMTLPFLSYGGSSLVGSAILAGLVLNYPKIKLTYMIKNKILIATGGTGGHVFPALGLANYLVGKNFNVQLTTDKRGAKYLKENQDLKFTELNSSPLNKGSFSKFLLSIFIIFFSIVRSLLFLLFNRPSIIFWNGRVIHPFQFV